MRAAKARGRGGSSAKRASSTTRVSRACRNRGPSTLRAPCYANVTERHHSRCAARGDADGSASSSVHAIVIRLSSALATMRVVTDTRGETMTQTLSAFLAAAILLAPSFGARAADITGAGATFPYPIYAKWAEAYKAKTALGMNYQSIGS